MTRKKEMRFSSKLKKMSTMRMNTLLPPPWRASACLPKQKLMRETNDSLSTHGKAKSSHLLTSNLFPLCLHLQMRISELSEHLGIERLIVART